MTPADTLLTFVDDTRVRWRGRTLRYFAGCNYLGLARHPRVLAAMRRALDRGVVQPGASRITTGEQREYQRLERDLASFFEFDQAALVTSGYLAPLAACQALREGITHVLVAASAHSCLLDAGRSSGRPVEIFSPAAPEGLRSCFCKLPRGARPLLLTEGTFGTRGGFAPLREYLELVPKRGWMLVDDAHGAGAVGPGGRGALAQLGLRDARLVLTISLAKALGVAGGAVLGPEPVLENLRRHAAAFIGSTAMPFATVAGVRAAITLLAASDARGRRLQANARLLRDQLSHTPEVSCDARTPVSAVLPTSSSRAGALRRGLLAAGIFPPFIRYVTGPRAGFFRFAVTSEHRADDVGQLARVVNEWSCACSSSPQDDWVQARLG